MHKPHVVVFVVDVGMVVFQSVVLQKVVRCSIWIVNASISSLKNNGMRHPSDVFLHAASLILRGFPATVCDQCHVPSKPVPSSKWDPKCLAVSIFEDWNLHVFVDRFAAQLCVLSYPICVFMTSRLVTHLLGSRETRGRLWGLTQPAWNHPEIQWIRSSCDSRNLTKHVRTLQETNISHLGKRKIIVKSSQCFGRKI